MKRFFWLLSIILICSAQNYAQDKKVKTTLKADVLNFRSQVVRSKEYKEEQRKIPALTNLYGLGVKLSIEIDVDDTIEYDEVTDPADNILTGYINISKPGTEPEKTALYTLRFDRTKKKIIDIKNEGNDTDQDLNTKEENK